MSVCCKYQIPINILTPIHIGSNDTFSANEYLFLGDNVYRINIVNYFNSEFNRKNQDKLIKRIQDENFSLSKLEYVDVDLLKSFSKYCLVNKCSSYPEKHNIQIECAIKSQNKLYIPGSSIKGAIKTALFYNAIKLNEISDINNRLPFNSSYSIMRDYFKPSENSRYNEILRFLQIEDSSNFDNIPHLHEVKGWHTEKYEKKLSTKGYDTRYLETIPESNTLQTVITTNYDKFFFKELNFNEEMENLLNINKISESLFSLADDIINFEIEFYSDFHKNDLVEFYEELMEYNYYDKPLISLGGASGILAKNIYLKFYEYDKRNNKSYSDNYIRLLLKDVDDSLFPKSRNLTLENNKPLGWAQLDFSSYI